MKNKCDQSEKFYREIPDKKDPGRVVPEKAPGASIPDSKPSQDNPKNPKEDLLKKFD